MEAAKRIGEYLDRIEAAVGYTAKPREAIVSYARDLEELRDLLDNYVTRIEVLLAQEPPLARATGTGGVPDVRMSDIVSLLLPGQDVARIRFDDEESRIAGLGVLGRTRQTFKSYRDGSYGLTSEEQVSMLERERVKFRRLD